MLFDLRNRGRRRTVQGVYLGLAVLMGGGLVLFGVGTGVGGGGLLNAFNGGGGNQSQVVSSQEKAALKATQQNPDSAAAWSSLVQARWTTATTAGTDYNASTQSFTTAGKKELSQLTQDYERYLQLTSSPDPSTALLAARAYAKLGDYGSAANAWEVIAAANPTEVNAYECLAVSAYGAGQTRKGDLATAKALSLLPKASRANAKAELAADKASSQGAQQTAQSC
jgi:tetratricopeptide (TPR) repeat protein